jgi:hypothetical protein
MDLQETIMMGEMAKELEEMVTTVMLIVVTVNIFTVEKISLMIKEANLLVYLSCKKFAKVIKESLRDLRKGRFQNKSIVQLIFIKELYLNRFKKQSNWLAIKRLTQ